MKRLLYTAALLTGILTAATSCQQDDTVLPGGEPTPDGYVRLRFGADIPDMTVVNTRAVDADGGGVQSMVLFCFDEYGLFTTTAEASIETIDEITGTFKADVPKDTRIIHFLANQNIANFDQNSFRNKSEVAVMAELEGSSGMMIYWDRFACDPANMKDNIAKQMEDKNYTLQLIRNHAQISINTEGQNYFTPTGFEVCNTNAFGTAAPYNKQYGGFVAPGRNDIPFFVTEPARKDVQSDIYEVVNAPFRKFVFESPNTVDNPVSVIIKGHNNQGEETEELYYHVMLVDSKTGDYVPICRNTNYRISFKGSLNYGSETFDEALHATPTNNVWISIGDDIDEVENNEYVLKVEQTNYVIAEKDITDAFSQIHYTLTRKDGEALSPEERPTVTWLDNNTVAGPSITNEAKTNDAKQSQLDGTVTIHPYQLGENPKLEGTLLVRKGNLQRKIKVITIKEQKFVPSWVSSQVYGGEWDVDAKENEAQHVTLMFTIPESCPAELFPMRVLISVNSVDVRSEAGVDLPVVRINEEGYGLTDLKDPEGTCTNQKKFQFKYVYTATGPGVQRVYFENILQQDKDYTGCLFIEAEHFALMHKQITYTDEQRTINVEGLEEYNNNPSDIFADDEPIYYRLVPQKKGAYVQFNMQLKEEGRPVNADAKDEFLVYAQHLKYYEDDEVDKVPGVDAFECEFHTIPEEWFTSNGQVYMFHPRDGFLEPDQTGHYSIYMYTDCAKSADVVRIASNEKTKWSAHDTSNKVQYEGNTYRSTTFELANYNPFRFSAQVNEEGNTSVTGDAEEEVTELTWTYEPEQDVTIDFDVTSFGGSDYKSVDPFGRQFRIFIDAPMLKIDTESQYYARIKDKLTEDPTTPGRFIYTVDEDREEERKYGFTDALKEDIAPGISRPYEPGQQTGERKRLPFKIATPVSAGKITLSSDEDEVVFFKKTFNVLNESISGSITYGPTLADQDGVPAGSAVSFAIKRNGSRIGSMSISEDGKYELRLRKEYEFFWESDIIEVRYQDRDAAKVYLNDPAKNLTLKSLFANPSIQLIEESR